MKRVYNFGISQEDPTIEAEALRLCQGDARIFSVTSSGDMPLSLLALGAQHVTAIDIEPRQRFLAELKLAALESLARPEAIAFLGYLPCQKHRRLAYSKLVMEALPAESRDFWRYQPEILSQGAIWAGRFERFIRFFGRLFSPLLAAKFKRLYGCNSLQELEQCFSHEFERSLLRRLFHLAFHPRVFRRRGMDPRSLRYHDSRVSLGDKYFDAFRQMCTTTLAKDNYLLQLFTLGRVLDEQTVPAFLSEAGYSRVRQYSDQIHFVDGDLVSHLKDCARGEFNRFHLSNVPDWLDQQDFEQLLTNLIWHIDEPSLAIWRYIHINRPVPEHLTSQITVDTGLGQRLVAQDRFPIYSLMPANLQPAYA